MNSVTLIGRLTRDPELRYLPNSGTAVCNFSLAVNRDYLTREKRQEMESKGQHTADFINIVVWGKQGENCANYLGKGRLVAIQGRIQTGSYTAADGTKRYTTDIVGEKVEFLEWGDDYSRSGNSNANTNVNTNDSRSDDFVADGFQPINEDDIPF